MIFLSLNNFAIILNSINDYLFLSSIVVVIIREIIPIERKTNCNVFYLFESLNKFSRLIAFHSKKKTKNDFFFNLKTMELNGISYAISFVCTCTCVRLSEFFFLSVFSSHTFGNCNYRCTLANWFFFHFQFTKH